MDGGCVLEIELLIMKNDIILNDNLYYKKFEIYFIKKWILVEFVLK